jgi:outer membrane biosynthesis protein TonB
MNPLDEGPVMPRYLYGSIVGLAVAAFTIPALAQQPSEEQIAAVRASCRSDFLSYCAGVPRGGAEALQCLKRNAAQLSPACQAAVNAIAAAAPKPEPKPAPAAPPPPAPAAAPPPAAAPAPAPAPAAAPPPAPAVTAPAPAANAPTAAPPKKRVAAPPKPGTPPVAAAPAAPPPAAQPTSLGPIPPLPPRVRLMILRACAPEHQAMCANVPPGGGRIVECLAANGSALSAGRRETILSVK